MSTVSTSIQLQDRISATIGNIISAIENVCSAFDSVEQSMDGGFDASAIDSARAALSGAVLEADRLGDEIARNTNEQNKFTEEVEESQASMGGLAKKAMGLAGAYFSINKAVGFVSNAMEGASLESSIQTQLLNVLKNTGAVQESIEEINKTAENIEMNGMNDSAEKIADTFDEIEKTVNGFDAAKAIENTFNELKDTADSFEMNGMYGGAEMLAGAGELATYISDPEAIKSMMGTLADYSAGMSGGGALNSDQIVEYGTQLGKALMGTYDGLKKKGFELTDIQKKIIDETATHAQIAEELGITAEEAASMSADMQKALVLDAVIGESWDGLYEAMSNTPEGKVASLNNAWGDVMDTVGHQLTPYVMHLYDTIMANMPQIKNLITNITNSLAPIIVVASKIISILSQVGGFVADNWSIIAPIIGSVTTALGLYTGALIVNSVIQGISNLSKTIGIIKSIAHGEAITKEMIATTGMTKSQLAFNAALYASPLTWILLIIIAVIAAIYIVIGVINKLTGTTISATGVIVGALMTAVAFIWNLFLGLLDLVLAIVNYMVNEWVSFVNFFANLFNDPIGSIIHLFGDFADRILGIIESIAKALDKVFGSNLAGAVQNWRNGLSGMVEKAANKYGNGSYEKVVDELNLSSESLGLKRWEYGDAYNTGYEWGENLESSFEKNQFGDLMDGLGEISENTSATAENTKGLSDTQEDLEYLRDIAEREVINRFTTAEISIAQTNNNNISSDMDIDGIMEKWNADFVEILETAAEGVHA